MTPVLDRRVPKDFDHVRKYPLRAAAGPAMTVERVLDIPRQYRDKYDQGPLGACVGYSQSWMMSILNRTLYDARRLYDEAQKIDEWPETPPEEGTSLRAGFDVLRTVGHWRLYAGKTRPSELDAGIQANRWARSAEEVRAAIAAGTPVNLGINWYRQFSHPYSHARHGDKPDSKRRDYWIAPDGESWGRIDGGHAITVPAWSDARDAVGLLQTWGVSYPFLVWMPSASLDRLLREDGEAGIVTDR